MSPAFFRVVMPVALALITAAQLVPAQAPLPDSAQALADLARREFRLPAGEWTESSIPDTLDLAARADLALNALGGILDPAQHYQMYLWVFYKNRTPWMQHHAADTTCDPKFAESFALMRLMSGSDRNAALEQEFRAALLGRIDSDHYWNRYDPAQPWRASYNPRFDVGQARAEDLSGVGAQGRMIRALIVWREAEVDPARARVWDDTIRSLVRGLDAMAVKKDDYAFFPNGGFGEPFSFPRSGWQSTAEPLSETEGGEGSVLAYQGHPLYAAAQWYAASGDPAAGVLAERLARFCMQPRFWGGVPDDQVDTVTLPFWIGSRRRAPAINGAEMGHWWSHFHARCIALRGILEYAIAMDDPVALEFVRRAYEYSWSLGIPRIGWINCFPTRLPFCEGCALGDLVALGIRLSDAGVGDYWDDVDAIVRNHLIEGQVSRADLLARAVAAQPERTAQELSPHPGQETTDAVTSRTLGAFFHATKPGGVRPDWLQSMSCCTSNGSQGLYYAWEAIVREQGDTAQVNLMLNRAARLIEIRSWLPYEGKVEIRNKGARRVAVRIPSWVRRVELTATVNGKPRSDSFVGNYLVVDRLDAGDVLTLEFPVRELTVTCTANSGVAGQQQRYTMQFRGGTCVGLEPREIAPGAYPFYLREELRQICAPLRQARQFIPEKVVRQW